METSAITTYCDTATGRSRGFSVGDVGVLVTPHNRDADVFAGDLAEDLAGRAEDVVSRQIAAEREAEDLRGRVADLERKLVEVTSRVPPPSPQRLLGPGYVRFTSAGALWLLGSRDKGWSSFGYRCDDWDDLFRRYNVRVTGNGIDEHGAWWEVANTPEPR